MKLIIQNNRIAATATDEYQVNGTEQMVLTAPTDFDLSRMSEYVYEGGVLTLLLVPQEVPMASARIILLRSGITAAMLVASINADTTTTAEQKAEALIDFEFRTTVRRESPLTLVLGPAMGLTSAQMDSMFIAAGAL